MPRHRTAHALAGVLLLAAAAGSTALAASGSPDCFGYTWADQCSGCEPDLPEFGPEALTFTAATEAVGPVDLGFVGRWYGRPVTQVWIAPQGYLSFSDQGPAVAESRFFADSAPPNDLFALTWIDVLDADISVEATPELFHVRWIQRWTLDPVRPWETHLLILPDGSFRLKWVTVTSALYATIGHEDAAGACGRTLLRGDPETFDVYVDEGTFGTGGRDGAACILPPTRLDCGAPEPLRCGSSLASALPGAAATPTAAWSCDSRPWAAGERAFELLVDELADVDVSLTPAGGRRQALFAPRGCDEWDCAGGGGLSLTVESVTPGAGALVFVDGASAGLDEGEFTIEATCRPLAETVDCDGVVAGSTLGGDTRLDEHACAPGDFSGPEAWYRVEVTEPGNLRVDLSSVSGQSVHLYDPARPLDPASCLAGGTGGAWLPDPAPGFYLVVVDGPAGSGGEFTLTLSCRPQLACEPGAGTLACNDQLASSTAGAAAAIDAYGCGEQDYSGPETVHELVVAERGTVSLRLDDSADERLDLILLDGCNEESCFAVADSAMDLELEAGSYRLVVDGREGAAGDYSISTTCGAELRPELLAFSADPGDCVIEHKTLWLAPEAPPVDVLFSLDLTGSMIEERDALAANIMDIVRRLPVHLPDVAFGIATHRDYHYPCLGLTDPPCRYVPSDFGQEGDWPYSLHRPITRDHRRALAAAGTLPPADLGGTSGESYGRVLHEAVHDPAVSWREGARRMVVTFGDDVPHDCDLAACLGGPSMQRGRDLGPDGDPESGDELEILDVVQELVDADTILLHLDSSDGAAILGVTYRQLWDCWAARTGGLAEEINPDGTVPMGLDLPELIASLVQRRLACPTLELVAEPGFEDWLVSASPVYFDEALPTVAEFDIRICVPPGTPEGIHEFEVRALCGSEAVAAQRVVATVGGCRVAAALAPLSGCAGSEATLDASASLVMGCDGEVLFAFYRDGLLIRDFDPAPTTTDLLAAGPTTYRVEVACVGGAACAANSTDEVVAFGEDDPLPPPLGLSLRVERRGAADLLLRWADLAPPDDAVSAYELLALDAVETPEPRPELVDEASLLGSVAPGVQELVHAGAASAPCRLDGRDVDCGLLFYKVRATSPCSGRTGPTCNGFPAQRAACP